MSSASRDILITADGTCDLPEKLLLRLGVQILPFRIVTRYGAFLDGVEVDAAGLSRCYLSEEEEAEARSPDRDAYRAFFSAHSRPGRTIFHISLASPAYASYDEAARAAEDMPDVTVFNSGQVSCGIGLVVLAACALARQGDDVETIVSCLSACREEIAGGFVLSSGSLLYGSGTDPAVGRDVFGRLLLRPLYSLKRGRIRAGGIRIGRFETVVRSYVRSCFRRPDRIDPEVIFIAHTGLSKKDLALIRAEVERYADFRQVIVVETSAAVFCTCGPGAFGLFFVRRGRRGAFPKDLLPAEQVPVGADSLPVGADHPPVC